MDKGGATSIAYRPIIKAVGTALVAGVLVYKAVKACRGPNGEARCPVTGAFSPAGGTNGGCPMSSRGGNVKASSPHGGADNDDCIKKKKTSRLSSILPFQPRAFTPEQLARCDGTHPDPLDLLKSASVDETCNLETSRQNQLQEDLSVTSHMVCISVRGIIFKVTPQFYGAGEPYSVYAGKEITRCLAIGIVGDSEANLPWNEGSAKAFAEYHHANYQNPKEEGSPIPEKALKAVEEILEKSDTNASYDGEFTAEELRTLDLWASKYEKKYQIVGWYAPFAVMKNDKEGGGAPALGCKTTKDVVAFVSSQLDLAPPPSTKEGSLPSTRRRREGAASANVHEAPPTTVL